MLLEHNTGISKAKDLEIATKNATENSPIVEGEKTLICTHEIESGLTALKNPMLFSTWKRFMNLVVSTTILSLT